MSARLYSRETTHCEGKSGKEMMCAGMISAKTSACVGTHVIGVRQNKTYSRLLWHTKKKDDCAKNGSSGEQNGQSFVCRMFSGWMQERQVRRNGTTCAHAPTVTHTAPVVVAIATSAAVAPAPSGIFLPPATSHSVGPVLPLAVIINRVILNGVSLPQHVPVLNDTDVAENVLAAVMRFDETEAARVPTASFTLLATTSIAATTAAAAPAATAARAAATTRAATRAPVPRGTVSTSSCELLGQMQWRARRKHGICSLGRRITFAICSSASSINNSPAFNTSHHFNHYSRLYITSFQPSFTTTSHHFNHHSRLQIETTSAGGHNGSILHHHSGGLCAC